MTYRIVLSREFPCPEGVTSSSILWKCQELLCKLYPSKGLDWAPGLTDAERDGLWEKHFGIKLDSTLPGDTLAVEFKSENDYLIHLIKWS